MFTSFFATCSNTGNGNAPHLPRCTGSFCKVRVRVVSHILSESIVYIWLLFGNSFSSCFYELLLLFLLISQPFFIDTHSHTHARNHPLLQSVFSHSPLRPAALRFLPLVYLRYAISFCTFFRKLGSTWFIYDSQIRYIMIATFNWHDHFFPSLLFVRAFRTVVLLAIKQKHSWDALFSITHKSRLNFYLMREREREAEQPNQTTTERNEEKINSSHHSSLFQWNGFIDWFLEIVWWWIQTTHKWFTEIQTEREKNARQMQHPSRKKMNSIRKSPFYLFYSWRIFVLLSLMLLLLLSVLFLICESNKWKNKMINVR